MNILFFIYSTVDPLHGGIHRVTDVLMQSMKHTHCISCLMLRKTSYTPIANDNFYYIPNEIDVFNPINISYVKKLCLTNSIDIIINQEGISPYTSRFILDAAPEHVKIISVFHSTLASCFGCHSKLPVIYSKWIPEKGIHFLNNLCYMYFRHKYGQHIIRTVERSSRIIVLDEHLLDDLSCFLGKPIPSGKLCAIHNPVTLPQGKYIPIQQKSKILLYVGRLSAEKNIIDLLSIWKKVSLSHPSWHFYLVGDGPEREKILKYIKNNGLRNISIEGRKNPIQYYQKASIFILASLYEGLPLVLLEAMNYSVIPVAFDSFPSLHSIITHEVNGMIVKPFDKKKYAQVLTKLMDEESFREDLSVKAWEHSQLFSINTILNEWNKVFNDIIKE